MLYRINAQGNVMSYSFGMWTTLPPKKARGVLIGMTHRQLVNLIQVAALVVAFSGLTSVYV